MGRPAPYGNYFVAFKHGHHLQVLNLVIEESFLKSQGQPHSMYDWWAFRTLDRTANWHITLHKLLESERIVESFYPSDAYVKIIAEMEPIGLWPPQNGSKSTALDTPDPFNDGVDVEKKDDEPGLDEDPDCPGGDVQPESEDTFLFLRKCN